MEKKQSSIDKFVQQLKRKGLLITEDSEYIVAYLESKAMHKEEIEKFNKFLNDEKKLGIADLKTIERIQWYYNTYFNETFGGNNE